MPKQILLADDSATIAKIVQITFAHEDYVVTAVKSGDEALARAKSERPDVVLLDAVMPGKSGYDICAALREAGLKDLPVLILSSNFNPYDEGKGQRAGADGHVVKPFETQLLIDRVGQMVTRSAARPAAATTPLRIEPLAPPITPAPPAPVAATPAEKIERMTPKEEEEWGEATTIEPSTPKIEVPRPSEVARTAVPPAMTRSNTGQHRTTLAGFPALQNPGTGPLGPAGAKASIPMPVGTAPLTSDRPKTSPTLAAPSDKTLVALEAPTLQPPRKATPENTTSPGQIDASKSTLTPVMVPAVVAALPGPDARAEVPRLPPTTTKSGPHPIITSGTNPNLRTGTAPLPPLATVPPQTGPLAAKQPGPARPPTPAAIPAVAKPSPVTPSMLAGPTATVTPVAGAATNPRDFIENARSTGGPTAASTMSTLIGMPLPSHLRGIQPSAPQMPRPSLIPNAPAAQTRSAAPAAPEAPAPAPAARGDSPRTSDLGGSGPIAEAVNRIAARGPEYEALAKLSREVIEQIAWEVVPELAEIMLKAELDRIVKERTRA